MSFTAVIESIASLGGMFTTVKDIVRNFVRDPNDADKLATEITMAFADIVKTEIGSQYWLAGNWRPIVMLMIALALVIKTIMGGAFESMPDYVMAGVLLFGLTGYRMDGRIVEFLKEMITLGKKEVKDATKQPAGGNPPATKTGG
jgi:hypothetical protein